MTVRIAAFDISSKLGWAAWDGAAPRPVFDMKPVVGFQYDAGSMLELYRKWLGTWLRAYQPELLVIEAWIVAAHGDADTSAKLIQLSGFTQWACKTLGVATVLVPASTWRKEVYGTGRGTSAEWKRKAKERVRSYGMSPPDDNAAEAVLILEYAIKRYGKTVAPWLIGGSPAHGGLLA